MRRLAFVAALVVGTASCGADDSVERVVVVPRDFATIGEAVSNARPGTTVEISPGTYHETIEVGVARVTIRGMDRNSVILDGQHQLANGILVVANDVAVENLTVRNYLQNGIVFNGISASTGGDAVDPETAYGTGDDVLTGYRVSWVTTHNNGLYGVYAFAARNGLIEHSYASGHPDSGFYVGQCQPCDVVITNVVAERNAIGYYGTNASGGVVVASSVFRHNRLGLAPNSQRMEKLSPQAEAIIVGNLVVDNDDPTAPAIPSGYFGGGIAVGGGTKNQILRNRVVGHDRAGIEFLDLDTFLPVDNRVEGNVLDGNAIDLAYAVRGARDGGRNCFRGNTFTSSVPFEIEGLLPCGSPSSRFDIPEPLFLEAPPAVDYRNVPTPEPQQSMPVSARRTAAGAGTSSVIEVASIGLPQ